MNKDLYSVKMRASRKENGRDQHISGAEKIVMEDKLDTICRQLLERALHHAKGRADLINLKIEKVSQEDVMVVDALPVSTCEVNTAAEGRLKLAELLKKSGIGNSEQILAKMEDTWGMRGAMLLNVDTMERLEPNHDRGIRATYMDVEDNSDDRSQKNHFKEALILATKVANHKNIIGELCISDDPDYVTGYFASKELGYVRITKLKEGGCPDGGRIFLFRGSTEEAADCIHFLEQQKMLVRI
ncbi:MAG: 6-carboxyhexanoate--CoA ligase [Clostridiaceae bacterium]|nr:6-carboxyhexanoate--CoA ligase [Clostridiaceae bacterium]